MRILLKLLCLLVFALPAMGQDLRPSAYVGKPKTVTVRGGKVQGATGGVTNLATQDITPAASSTTYIFVDLTSTPVISSNTTGFPTSSYFPICVVITDINGIITSFTDSRPDAFMAGGGGGGNQRVINATDAKYNLPASGIWSCVANYTNASQNVATDALDAPFTAAMVGWQIFLTSGPCQGINGAQTPSAVQFNGTISAFTDAHHVVLSGTPTASCAGSSGTGVSCRMYAVPSDSAAALNSAWADATTTRGQCYTLQLPAGLYKFNTSIKSSAGCQTIAFLSTGTAINGPSVQGVSMAGTILVADPTFDAATCTAGNNCVFAISGVQSLSVRDLTISGGGNGTVTNGNGKCKIGNDTGWPSVFQNIQLDYWGQNTVGFTGICAGGGVGGTTVVSNVNNYNGGYACAFFDTETKVDSSTFLCPAGSKLQGGGVVLEKNYWFTNSAGGPTLTIQNPISATGYTFIIKDTTINGSVNNMAILNQTTAPVILDGDVLLCTATSLSCYQNGGGGAAALTYASRTSFTTNGTANITGNVAGSVFVDMGGNTTVGTAPNTLTNQTIIADGHSVTGKCTGVATASQTLGLYGTGPNETLTTCTSTTIGSGIPINGARTALNLIVTSTAGGVNASSGVVTVLKNAGATTITCTIGTGTSCQDGSHRVSFADGDLISIQFTTQAAETLAGVKAFIEWQ